ncbi:MAG: hypothetical protein H0W04_10435 [Chthoniobacterales bacterium]|nr:hypothetical protein [Chthoniobacterales bacterium]
MTVTLLGSALGGLAIVRRFGIGTKWVSDTCSPL